MRNKTMRFELRLTSREKDILKRRAKKYGMSPSEFVRSYLIHSDNLSIAVIDTEPIRKLFFEIHKHGVNLNQLMKFCNTYGLEAFNESHVIPALESERMVFLQTQAALESLREEAAKQNVTIRLETDCESGEEEEGRHGEKI